MNFLNIMSYLKLENISKNFGDLRALSDINLKINEGQFCVLLGPSGCGKSTLLNIIAGLEEPTTGKISLGGKDITNLPAHKRDIAMVFQSYALYPHLSVFENMAFGLRIRKMDPQQIKQRIEKVSKILGLEDKLRCFPKELSGGQKQRVATGRAIVREPKLFLFDEPLSNLDARLRVELRTEFIKLHNQLKTTTFYVTHDQMEAMILGEIVVVLKDGVIQQTSSPGGLYENPKNLFVASFLGTPPMNIILLEVVNEDNNLMLANGDFCIKPSSSLKDRFKEYTGKKIYFGFRPTAAKITRQGTLTAEVVFWETLGEESFVLLALSKNVTVSVKADNEFNLKTKDKIGLDFDWDKVYFFDQDQMRINI